MQEKRRNMPLETTQRIRPPKENIPQTWAERSRILQTVRNYVAEFNPVPPMPLDHLREHADRVARRLNCNPACLDYISVVISNEIWRDDLAAVPFNRRLLLLPKCLRSDKKCVALMDDFGLICKKCGSCSINDLQSQAEELGYAVLVAEGSAIVMSMIQTGKIDAIIGVSCLNVLEKAFPYMEAASIPGVAIPLLQDDCVNTAVDLEWVWDYIHLTSADKTSRMDLARLRTEVDSWFAPATLDAIMGAALGETEVIAREWLARAGKRWRPFLAVAAFQAQRGMPSAPIPDDIRKIAVAVECFHKASLIHDDIEDGDALRYGEKTMHEEYGIPVALNVGDLLIGEGYRLIGACDVSFEQKARMAMVAAEGQRQLCRGQGAELAWARQPQPLSTMQVIDIFRRKTAPAFEVALRLGTLYADGQSHDILGPVLAAYSEALGIAYQIRDDLSDLGAKGETNDIAGLRPSLLLAVAYERAHGDQKAILDSLWRRALPAGVSIGDVEAIYTGLKADERAQSLLESYMDQAIRSLRGLENPSLKGLLRRVIGKIFSYGGVHYWCREFEHQKETAGQ